MSNVIDVWYDAVLKQMAAEVYLEQVNLSLLDDIKNAMERGNNRPGFNPLGLTRFSASQATDFLSRFQIVHQWSDAPLRATIGPNDSGYLALNGQQILANSGLSATLIKNIDPTSAQFGSYTLSIRSTEYQNASAGGDRDRDLWGADAGGIFLNGFALAQWNALEQYYSYLKSTNTLPGGATLHLTGYSLSSNLTTLFTETHPEVVSTVNFNGPGRGTWDQSRGDLQAMLEYYRTVLANPLAASPPAASAGVAANAAYVGAQSASGGLNPRNIYEDPRHRWAAFATSRDFGASFNPFSDPERTGLTNGADARITQLYGQAETGDTQYVANSGIHGPTQRIFIEDQSDVQNFGLFDAFGKTGDFGTTHSITLVSDSLALMRLFTKMAPSITHEKLRAIFAAASNERGQGIVGFEGTAEGDSLERVVEALGKVFGATMAKMIPDRGVGGFANTEQRNTFFANLKTVSDAMQAISNVPGAFGVISLADMSATSLKNLATDGDIDAMAYRFALKELHPFAVFGPNLYQPHHQNGELDIFVSTASTPGGMTTQYLTDRAQMLAFLNSANTSDTSTLDSDQVEKQVRYTDLTMRSAPGSPQGRLTNLLVSRPGSTPDARGPNIVGFGTDSTDVLQGHDNTDRLYGGLGVDVLTGGRANDYLEGGAGFDVYHYNASTLGSGANDGADEIRDTDGRGVLRYSLTRSTGLFSSETASTVIGGAAIKLAGATWQSPDAKFTYDQQGSDGLLVTINGDAGGSITIRDFDFGRAAQSGHLGIRLIDAPLAAAVVAPATTRDITGDLKLFTDSATVAAESYFIPNPLLGGPPIEQFRALITDPSWRLTSSTVASEDAEHRPLTFSVTYNVADDLDNLVRTAAANPDFVDVFNDSSGNDLIVTAGAADTITATRGGDDWIVTGGGEDTIADTSGNNLIDAGAGMDRIETGADNDWILAGDGNDVVVDAGGANLIQAGAGRDIVIGGPGNDWVEGGTEGDILDGLDGADVLWADSNAGGTLTVAQGIAAGETGTQAAGPGDLLSGNTGDDVLIGAASADYLAGGEGADVIAGGAGDDTIHGDQRVTASSLGWSVIRTVDEASTVDSYIVTRSAGFTAVEGEGVADTMTDTIYGGTGADWIFAGAGDDFVSAGDTPGDANVLDDVVLGEGGSDIVIGGSGRDVLDGDSFNANADGTFGDDFLDGGAGDDTLYGGKGDDVLIGGQGQDQLVGGEGKDVLYGGADTDILQGGAGKDTYVYYRGDGVDVVIDPDITTDSQYRSALALGPGIAKEQVKFRLGSLMVDLGQGDAIHFDGFNPDDPLSTPLLDSIQFADGDVMTYQDVLDQGFDLDGTEGNDYIKGTAVTDRIDAKGGNDIIEAGAGNDLITTGAGADVVFGNAGDDRVVAGDGDLIIDLEGANTLDLTDYAGLTQANLEITQYRAPDGDIYLSFHVRDDMSPGVTPATGGVSVQYGEIGNFASVTVSDGAEGTVELSYEELMTQYAAHGLVYSGTAAAELLIGTQFADTFFGQGGADTIRAGAGDDKMDGGAGDDTLEGGAGNDTYLLGYNRRRDTVIEDGAAEPNATHTILLDAGIPSSLVYARQSGNDLEVRLRATGDALVLKDFYLQPQSWQDGWQVRDRNGALTELADYVPVIPPQAATWLEEEEQAYRARREQVFAANRQADGFLPLGDNVFQHTEQVFNYAGASVNGSTTTLSLVAETQSSDAGQIAASTQFTSTPIGVTNVVVDIGLPVVQGTGGEKSQVSAEIGTGGASSGGAFEFFSLTAGGGGSFQLNPGDYAVPVYGPTFGNAQGLSSAGVLDYASAGNFNNSTQWRLIGYNVFRAGSGGSSPESVAAVASYQNYDQHLTVQDVVAGGSGNTISAATSVVEGGAGNDPISLDAGYFFVGPDWESAFDLAATADASAQSAAQDRYLTRFAGLSGWPLLYPARPNLLGGFAFGDDGDDSITGSVGQDVIAGGNGVDVIDARQGSDRVLVRATDSGIDTLTDSGVDALAYLDHFYWSRGILNWDERVRHANEWRVDNDGEISYFDTQEKALIAVPWATPVLIAALPEAAPVLTREAPLYEELVAAGVLGEDVLEFGPGLTLQDLDISVQVDTFSAQDHPELPWINGGHVAIRWGTDSGVDFEAPALNAGYDGQDLLTGGWLQGPDDSPLLDGSWQGYRLGEGFEAFRFADGTTLTLDQLLANATVGVDESLNYILHRDSGYQLIDRRYASIQVVGGVPANEVQVTRDGSDLLISVAGTFSSSSGAQGRIRDWYADPQAMPQTGLVFEFDPALDAAALTARGLEVHGTFRPETLVGLDGFADRLFGEFGNDTLLGGSGDDTLVGGGGSDYLDGGAGADTYLFASGDGEDTVADADPSVIVFGPDIFSWQIQLGLGSLVVNYGGGDAIHFTAFDAADPFSTPVFERLEFADGSSLTFGDLLSNGFFFNGTEGDDVFAGTGLTDRVFGNGGNDVLSGRGAQDDLDGGAGDDTLAGGPGEMDSMAGGEGADTYVYAAGDGIDDIVEWDETPGEEDRVQLQAIQVADVKVTRDPWSYFLQMGSGDRLALNSMARESAAVVERVEFADGTVWTPADVAARVELLPATEGDDVLWGTAANDTISGLGGWDTLAGNAGDDILIGGEGGDFYYFAAGDSHDVIDNIDTDGSYDSIQFADAASTDAVLSRSGSDLVFTAGADSVAIAGWYADPNRRIDGIYFEADGVFWDAAMIEQLAPVGGNSAPQVAIPLADLSFEAGAALQFLVSPDTFVDPDAGDVLALSATLYDGSALPAWLTFDPSSGAFAGLPQASNIGISHVAVTATDASGESATSDFGLVVRAAAGSTVTGGAADDAIYGGTGDETLIARGGSDFVYGDAGDDLLRGGNGNDVLQGGAGSDILRGGAGQNVLDGGAGDDLIYGGQGSAFIAGGTGNDILRVGSGNDVIAFNAGDGMDTIYGGRDGGNTLSFGDGIRYSDLRFSKSGRDLVVSTGAGEGVTLKNWYGGNHSVLSLQIILDATEEFDAASGDPLHNRRVQTFDFQGMVSAFDAARVESPGLTSWAMTNALLQFHLSGADDAALGGDLAYWYGKNRTLQGVSVSAAQQVIGASGFGSEAQSLRPFSGLQEGFVKLA